MPPLSEIYRNLSSEERHPFDFRKKRNSGIGVLLLFVALFISASAQAQTNQPPDVPVLLSPENGATEIMATTNVSVAVSDPDADPLTVTFYGRKHTSTSDFVIAVFGDSQNYYSVYSSTGVDYFKVQTNWVVQNREAKNIALVAHVGDVVSLNNASEWVYTSNAIAPLEDSVATGLTYGIPFDLGVGNHDQIGGTSLYNTYFGINHFTGRTYYGGSYSSGDNDNHYDLFAAGGTDFVVIELEFAANSTVLSWANDILKKYSDRRAIVISHDLIQPGDPGSWDSYGSTTYNAIKANPNLFLMLCGHNGGDGKRTDVYNGNTVYTLMADYSGDANGGNGYIRLLNFSAANNNIHVETYSPTAGTRKSSPVWDLPFQLGSPFKVLGTVKTSAGSNATATWSNLAEESEYEWYTTVSDGTSTTAGPNWTFSTRSAFPPLAPSGLSATAVPTKQVNLTWTDNATNESGFEIHCSTDAVNFVPIGNLDANTTSYSDTGLTGGTTYYYQVRAINQTGESAFSNPASATIAADVPAAPITLTATAAGNQIILGWIDKSTNEDGFEIEHSEDGVSFNSLATVAANSVAYTDTPTATGINYYYRVRAFNSAGESSYSNAAYASVWQMALIPAADATIRPDYPNTNFGTTTDLIVDADTLKEAMLKFTVTGVLAKKITTAKLRLWVSTDGSLVTGGSFYRVADNTWTETGVTWNNAPAADSTPFATLGRVNANYWYEVDLAGQVTGDGTYSFRVKSPSSDAVYYSSKEGSNPPQLIITLQDTPPAPSNLTAVTASTTQIDLGWTNTATNADAMRVERSLDAGTAWVELVILAGTATSFSDTTLTPGTAASYRVRASNVNGYSAYSNTASASTTQVVPAAPSGLTAVYVSSSGIELAWTDNSNNEQGFKIERSEDGTSFAPLKTVAADLASYTDAALTPDRTYYYRVSAYNSSGASDYSNSTSASSPKIAPAAPSSLTANAISGTQVNLSWTDNANNEEEFSIERSTDGGSFAPMANVSANIVTYGDTGLTAGKTYSYRVRATNSAGDSDYSNTASAKTPQVPPAAPTGLAGVAVSSSQINLNWVDASDNEDGFQIEHSNDGSTFALLASVEANVSSYSHTGLTAGTKHYYRVRATNSAGGSDYSSVVSATTPQVPPSAPTNLTVDAVSSGQINLAWTDNANNESDFSIERSLDNISFSQIATVGANVTAYSNTGLTAATVYYYRVRATNTAGPSEYSNTAGVMTPQVKPSAPSNLTATATGSSQINLAWTDNSNNETGFKIERSLDNVNFVQIVTVLADVKVYSDTGLTAATTYYYRVRSTNTAGDSENSNTASATTTQAPPLAPTNLIANPESSTQINLSWSDNANNETGFRIERSTGDGSFTQIATAGANVTSYSNTRLTAGTTYSYRVRAYNAVGNSGYSNTATTATPQVAPSAPSSLSTKAASGTSIQLSWRDNSNNEESFRIERSPDGTTFTEIVTVPANTRKYLSSGLSVNTKYWYRVRASNSAGNSTYSNTSSATTLKR